MPESVKEYERRARESIERSRRRRENEAGKRIRQFFALVAIGSALSLLLMVLVVIDG